MTRAQTTTIFAVTLVGATAAMALGGRQSETVTFIARPAVVAHGQPVTAIGAVESGRPDQLVAIQALPCDQPNWRDVAETYTRADGSWTVDFRPGISGKFRAFSGGSTSQAVSLQQRPFLYFNLRRGKFSVAVQAQRPFWHRRARVERFDPASGTWVTVKRVLLTNQESGLGDPFIYTSSDAFTLAVPKGTTLRATLPADQARPCYAAGYSASLRR